MEKQQIDIKLLYEKIKESGLTFKELSDKTGISASHLSFIFSGKRNLTIKKLNLILKATEIDVKDITRA